MEPKQDDGLVFEDTSAATAPDLGGQIPPAKGPSTPNTPVERANAQPAPDESSTFGYVAKEAGKAVLSGTESAVRQGAKTALDLGKTVMGGMGQPTLDVPGSESIGENASPAPESALGQVAADLVRVTLGYLAAPVKAAGAATFVTKSAIGTGFTSDPNAKRLSNMLEETPWLGPIFETLAQNPTDSVAVSKAKAMMEDMVVTTTGSMLFKGLHLAALKTWEKATGKAAAPAVTKAIEDEAAAAIKEPSAVKEFKAVDYLTETDRATYESLLKADQTDFTRSEIKRLAQQAKTSYYAKSSTNGSVAPKVFEPKQPAKDLDLVTATPGTRAVGEEVIPMDKIRPGHALDTEKGQLSLGKYQRALLEDADSIPGTIVTKNIDGTFTTVSGNARHEAMKLGGYDAVKATVVEEAGFRQAAQTAVLEREAAVFAPNGDALVRVKGKQAVALNKAMDELVQNDYNGIKNVAADANAGPVKGAPNQQYLDANSPNTIATLEQMGKVIRPQLAKSVPEYRSIDSTVSLGQLMGESPEQLAGQLRVVAGAMHDIDAVAVGARQVLLSLANDTFLAARKNVISGTPETKLAYEAAIMRHSQFQADLSAVTTGLGRGLRSFGEKVGQLPEQDMASILKDPQKAETLMKAIAASEGDAEKIAMVLKLAKMGGLEKAVGAHNEYWIGLGLLSRVSTQVVNLGSTMVNTLSQPAVLAVGHAERLDWKSVKESIAIYNGLRTSIMDSAHLAAQSFKMDKAIISQAGTMEQKFKFITSTTFNRDPNSIGGKIIDGFGELARLSFRGLTAGDEFFKQLSYRAKVSASASREAMDLVRAGQMEKSEVQKFVKNAVDNSFDGKGAATNESALRFAEKSAFVQDLKVSTHGGFASMGELMANMAGHPVLRGTLLPFVKTPTNVLRTQFEYTPVIGQLRKAFWNDVVTKGGEDGAMALGKMTVGLGLAMGIGYHALEGRFTGAPPGPGIKMPEGYKPYSVVIYNDDGVTPKRYIPYDRLQPWGGMIGVIVDAMQISGYIDGPQRDSHAAAIALSLANNLINKTYLRSLTEFTAIFGGYNAETKLERWMDNKAGSYVPGMIAQFNNDDSQREVRSMLDAIIAKTPNLSQSLPAKRDYLGQTKPVSMGLPWSLISPSAVSEAGSDPVMKELSRLSTGPEQVKFFEPNHRTVLNGQKFDLKEIKNAAGVSAFDRMVDLIQTVKPLGESKTFRSKLEEVMHDPRYTSAPKDGTPEIPGVRSSMIKAEESKYRKAAYEQMVSEYRKELGLPDSVAVPVIRAYDRANRSLSKAGQDLLQYGNQ